MGLDMYLYLRKYDSCWEDDADYAEKRKNFYPPELKTFAEKIEEHNFMSKTETYQVGYWRKANAIHNWIVNKCANGVDDCREVYVGKSKAKELLSIVEKVLSDHTLAPTLLPTSEGFFFGSQEYDEWYFKDLEYTKDLLERVIDFCSKEPYDIIYDASW